MFSCPKAFCTTTVLPYTMLVFHQKMVNYEAETYLFQEWVTQVDQRSLGY